MVVVLWPVFEVISRELVCDAGNCGSPCFSGAVPENVSSGVGSIVKSDLNLAGLPFSASAAEKCPGRLGNRVLNLELRWIKDRGS